jgi:hypothetical protein
MALKLMPITLAELSRQPIPSADVSISTLGTA